MTGERSSNAPRKLLVIGWDAADWSVLNPLLSSGKMPALASLMSRGFHGRLSSLQPMLSPLLWTSVATGVRAHEHGVLNFVEVSDDNTVRAVRGSSRRSKAFWEILHEAGYTSNVIGWWPSHPAEDSGGVQVSNFFQKSPDEGLEPLEPGCVYPPERSSDYEDLRVHVTEMTERILAPFFAGVDEIGGDDPIVSAVAKIIANTTSIHAAATEAMAKEEWDVTAVYYDAIDHFKHLAMAYYPPKSDFVSDDDYSKYKLVVEAGYRFHDMMLERLLDLAGESAHVLLLSDHGFASGRERRPDTPDIPGGPAAEHHPYGILVGAGPEWKKQRVHGHSLLDICPAILHLFEQPIGSRMTGAVPHYWWHKQRASRSMEYADRHERAFGKIGEEQQLLNDLDSLGYIDLPADEREAVKQISGDTLYNEIVSLIDGGHWAQAHEKSAALCYAYPMEARYAYQKLGLDWILDPPSFEDELLKITQKFPSLTGHFFLGMHALKQGFYEEALGHFRHLEKEGELSPAWISSVGKALIRSGRTEECIEWLLPIHDQFERWAEPSFILAQAYEQQAKDESELSRALDYALEAVRRRYFYPEAHLSIARLAVQIGAREPADTAYEVYLQLVPNDQAARMEHVSLLRSLGMNREADISEQKALQSPPIVIVSGWPRSGTSMMMQMLKKGGLAVYSDEKREADQHNPEGYFEAQQIMSTATDKSWVSSASYKAAKVITPLLPHLPGDKRYLILQMVRPLTDVITSQEVMMGKEVGQVKRQFPFGKAMQMQQEEQRIIDQIEGWGNVRLVKIDYDSCIHDPLRTAERVAQLISRFMPDSELDARAMASAVKPELNRQGK